MFHRVLARADVRWASADPEYTLSDELFDRALAFFGEHYHPVSEADVLAARERKRALPDCPLLITFDDGWADNADYALPLLAARKMPALLFTVSDAVGQTNAFWQERVVGAWLSGAVTAEGCARAWGAIEASPALSFARLDDVRRLVTRLERAGPDARAAALSALGLPEGGPRQMVSPADVARLVRGGVAIGSHGQTHEPLDRARDGACELARSRDALGALLGSPPRSMSFPHGRHTRALVAAAHEGGYSLCFTSHPSLDDADRIPGLLGRIGFTTESVTDERGRFREEQLALLLFRGRRGTVPETWAPGDGRARARVAG